MEIAFKRIRYAYGNRIAAVVHLAAYYDFAGKPSPLYQKITVEGTERLLRVLQGFDVNNLSSPAACWFTNRQFLV